MIFFHKILHKVCEKHRFVYVIYLQKHPVWVRDLQQNRDLAWPALTLFFYLDPLGEAFVINGMLYYLVLPCVYPYILLVSNLHS